jgi:hypothetical protein
MAGGKSKSSQLHILGIIFVLLCQHNNIIIMYQYDLSSICKN